MTPATPVLDVVDRSFLWHADQARRHPSRLPHGRDAGAGKTEKEPATSRSAAPVAKPLDGEPVIAASIHPEPVTDDGMGSLVDRLLRVVPHAWAHLATRVEDAHREGAEVVAITGARRGEGRTTLA